MDFIFEAFSAFNQAVWICAGLFLLLIAALFIGDHFYWQTRALRIRARVKELKAARSKVPDNGGAAGARRRKEKTDQQQGFWDAVKESPGSGLLGIVFILLIVGLPLTFAGIGAWQAHKFLSLKAGGQQASAVVVRNEASTGDDGTSYYAVVSFTDRNGRSWEVKDNVGAGSSPSFSAGQKLTVFYDADDPERFVIDDFWHYMVFALVFMAFGLGFLFLLFIGLVLSPKEENGAGGEDGRPVKPDYAGEIYYPVYEYVAPNGETIEAMSDTGSNSLKGKEPGSRVEILVMPHMPERARRDGIAGLVIGLIVLAFAAGLFCIAFGTFKTTFFTVMAVIGVGAYGASRFIGKIKPRKDWSSPQDWIRTQHDKFIKKYARMETLSKEEYRARRHYHDRMAGYWLPVIVILGLAALAGGYYLGMDMRDLAANGLRTEGEVVRLESRSSDDGYTYYARVRYHDANGRATEFTDSAGASHPLYERGDRVKVLYDPALPRDAIIDRGVMNWFLSGGLMAAGVLLIFMALRSFAGIRQRARR